MNDNGPFWTIAGMLALLSVIGLAQTAMQFLMMLGAMGGP